MAIGNDDVVSSVFARVDAFRAHAVALKLIDVDAPREAKSRGPQRPMRVLRDHEGVAIRLTDERLIHILERPEMRPFGHEIEQALATPLRVIESLSDPSARLYYRHYDVTPVGAKFLCVVVRFSEADSFVLTAYLTSRVKRGVLLWPRRK